MPSCMDRPRRCQILSTNTPDALEHVTPYKRVLNEDICSNASGVLVHENLAAAGKIRAGSRVPDPGSCLARERSASSDHLV